MTDKVSDIFNPQLWDEVQGFKFEDITMRIAEVVSDIETTNFCIAGSL